eukprot:TRINITY_DN24521_c0_g1_i1.p2 TRINITY_DN24521_c0_g1~~TRINITY_DN24521_c0_g1_i1.p2  ORF type:complete len:124 (+),score=6.17 TRINITY_DN24521_c0_g1_i1:80-451(+)
MCIRDRSTWGYQIAEKDIKMQCGSAKLKFPKRSFHLGKATSDLYNYADFMIKYAYSCRNQILAEKYRVNSLVENSSGKQTSEFKIEMSAKEIVFTAQESDLAVSVNITIAHHGEQACIIKAQR